MFLGTARFRWRYCTPLECRAPLAESKHSVLTPVDERAAMAGSKSWVLLTKEQQRNNNNSKNKTGSHQTHTNEQDTVGVGGLPPWLAELMHPSCAVWSGEGGHCRSR